MNAGRGKSSRAPIVRVNNFLPLADLMTELGLDRAECLTAAGLPLNLFDRSETTVRLSDVDRLVLHCEKAAGCDDLGFQIGSRQGAASIGVAGLVSINCATVREAWRTIVIGLKTTDTLGAVTLSISGDRAQIGYELHVREVESRHLINDVALATIVNGMRDMRGPDWRPAEARLTRSPPRHPSRFEAFYRCPVAYDAPTPLMVFPAAELDNPLPGALPAHRRVLAPLLEQALAQSQDDFIFEARAILRSLVAVGATPTQEAFCDTLAIGRDKLKRRFRAQGLTFTDLVEEARVDVAQTLLRNGKPVGEVALAVGYTETSSFTRAFTKSVGMPPSRWRDGEGVPA
jgi:AraC-like DNA-binding protein